MIKSEDLANVRGMKIDGGRVTMDLEVAHELMLAIAASAVAILEGASAPNFIEMELKSANADIPHTVVSIAYINRPTPLEIIEKLRGELLFLYNDHQLVAESEARVSNLMVELGYGDMLDEPIY